MLGLDRNYGKFATVSDVGIKRESNQDYFVFRPSNNELEDLVFGGIAGMGGYAAGEDSAEVVAKIVAESLPNRDLTKMIEEAEHSVLELARTLPFGKTGATGIIARVSGDTLEQRTVGDVRMYVFDSKGKLIYRSLDQSKTQEWLESDGLYVKSGTVRNSFGPKPYNFNPSSNLLSTRNMKVLSTGHIKNPSHLEKETLVNLNPGYQVLILTDGAHGPVPNGEIISIYESGETNPQTIVRKIREMAIKHKSDDNLTAVAYVHKSWAI